MPRAGERLGARPRLDRHRRPAEAAWPAAAARRRCCGPEDDSESGSIAVTDPRQRAGGRLGPRPRLDRRSRPAARPGRGSGGLARGDGPAMLLRADDRLDHDCRGGGPATLMHRLTCPSPPPAPSRPAGPPPASPARGGVPPPRRC